MFDQCNLPVLGLGVSLSLADKPSPLSLYHNTTQSVRPQFVEYAGQCDVSFEKAALLDLQQVNVPLLFHPAFINFCGSQANSSDWLETANQHIQHIQSPWFAQDCAYCFFSEQQGYASQMGYFIAPIMNQASLALAVERVQEVQHSIHTPVLVEPPPVSFVVGNLSVFEFFGAIAEQADCGLLLDMGHLVSYEMATGVSVFEGIDQLPTQRVIELHIAGGRLIKPEQPIYIDAHESAVLDETWQMLDKMLPHLPHLKAVCFECEGVEESLVFETLGIIRDKIIRYSANSELINKVQEQAVSLP